MLPNTHSPAPEGLVYSLCAPTIPVHNFFAGLWWHLLIVHFHLCLVHKTVNPLREEIVFLIFVFTVPAIQNSFSGYLRASSRKLMRKKKKLNISRSRIHSLPSVTALKMRRKTWGCVSCPCLESSGAFPFSCWRWFSVYMYSQNGFGLRWPRDVEPRKCWPPLSKDSIKMDLRKDKVPCLEESKILKACWNKAL